MKYVYLYSCKMFIYETSETLVNLAENLSKKTAEILKRKQRELSCEFSALICSFVEFC